jgi:hypothetical protein
MPQTPAKHDPAPEQMALVLRERIYGGITCLSTLLILVRHSASDSTPSASAVDVAVGGGALWAASVFADYVSHVVAHGRHPRGAEIAHGLWASGQIRGSKALSVIGSMLVGGDDEQARAPASRRSRAAPEVGVLGSR